MVPRIALRSLSVFAMCKGRDGKGRRTTKRKNCHFLGVSWITNAEITLPPAAPVCTALTLSLSYPTVLRGRVFSPCVIPLLRHQLPTLAGGAAGEKMHRIRTAYILNY